ncbi:uncharacterized protein H6S33_008160 [Morchella sextelata]|uniref:uncharacterized protein n=1 Tax=Morchella sextelata TaxID=1174677 RepID=UPI001D059EAF|nr:uncharacterized protein H6S33_008160 [Morchella sextelata]KAH0603156.1 hypothetical protein H6S33_008160 [Morchella sextelata]
MHDMLSLRYKLKHDCLFCATAAAAAAANALPCCLSEIKWHLDARYLAQHIRGPVVAKLILRPPKLSVTRYRRPS